MILKEGNFMLRDKKIFILGMARSGFEAAKLLAPLNEVFITDIKEQKEENLTILKDLGVTFVLSDNPTILLDDSYDVLIKNPGIKYDHPTVVKAKDLGIPVINELELAFHYLNPEAKIIGITGSNGKTTTTTLIYEMLKEDGKRVFLGGNIGTPFCHFVLDVQANDYVVLEVSDHQLCDVTDFKTDISVLTNIYQVHLDFHDSFDRYKMMKKKIFAHHSPSDLAIINRDNEEAMHLTEDILSSKEYFSREQKEKVYLDNGQIYYDGEPVISTEEILLKGNHNYENVMAAILAVKACGVSTESICKVLKRFKGVEHRLEYVDTIDGVLYYNDSKATNCESTKIALNSFQSPTLLLLGGTDRGHAFEDLDESLKHVKYVACYGETKMRIKAYCEKRNISCDVFDTLSEATRSCHDKAGAGDVVLLSPACASWDQYNSFEERGEEFKNLVKQFGGLRK